MILRLVLCFWFLCFVHCDSGAIGTEDNTAQLKTNWSTAEKLSEAEPAEPKRDESRKGDNSIKTLSPSKEHKGNEKESVGIAGRAVSHDGDQSRNNEGSGRRTFETPEVLVKGYPQKGFESNGKECYSPLSVKNIIKSVLEHVKKHPDALDLIINDIKSKSEEEAESSEFQNDPIHNELRSLPKPFLEYKLFDTNNGCPLSIIRFLKQIPKFLSQLQKYPQCLFPIFGCNHEFKLQSTSSHFCESLHIILNLYKIPRPESRPIYEFISSTPEASFEIMEPELQTPFYLQESNESQQEFEVLPQEQITIQQKEIQTDVIEPFERLPFYVPVNIQPDIFYTEIPKANVEEDIPTYVQEPIFDRYPKPIHIEETEPAYSPENFEPVYGEEPTYIEEHKPLYIDQPESIYIQESRPIYPVLPEPIYIEEAKHKMKPIYIEGSKPFYVNQPTSEVEPIYIAEPELVYVEEPKPISEETFEPATPVSIYIKKPETIYMQESESTHIEVEPIYFESEKPQKHYFEDTEPSYIGKPPVEKQEVDHAKEIKPYIKPIVINEPAPVYVEKLIPMFVDEFNHQKLVPIYSKELKPIAIQEPEPMYIEEKGPVNKPNYYFDEPKPIFNQYPIYFEESTPNYEIESSPTYEEDFNLDDVKENPKPIYVDHPELNYDEELNPGNKPIVIDEPAPIYVNEPQTISIQEPESFYIDERGPFNNPNYFKEPKLFYNQYHVLFEEFTTNHEIESSSTHEEDFSLDGVKEKTKPLYVKHPELITVDELKPGDKPMIIDEPAHVYVETLNPVSIDESTYQKPVPIIHVKEPKPIIVQEPESMFIEDRGPANNPIYFTKPKPIYIKYPTYFEEPTTNYEIESSPTYEEYFNLDDVKKKPKPIYVEHPELNYDEELNPGSKPIVIDEPTPINVNEPQTISIQEPEPMYIEEKGPFDNPIYFKEPKQIYNQYHLLFEESTTNYEIESSPTYDEDFNLNDDKEKPKPIYVDNSELTYVNNKHNPMIEVQPVYVEDTIPTHEKEYINEKPRNIIVEALEPNYIDKAIFVEKPKQIPINNPVYIEEPEILYTDEMQPEPTYVEKERDYREYPDADIYFEQSIPESISKPQPIFVEKPKRIPINNPETVYIEEPEISYTAEMQPEPTYVEKERDYREYPEADIYFDNPKHIYFQDQDTIRPEESELFYNDQLTHVEDSKLIYVEEPEMTYINKLIPTEKTEDIPRPQTPKEQTKLQVHAQILPSNVVDQIIQLIRDSPEKHVNNIMKVLKENQDVFKPKLFKILFSLLNALIKGIVDSERFNEIVKYLIQPRIDSEWNNKKTQILNYLLLPGNTGQVEVSILDIIYGLIHQPENTTNNPQMLDLIFPLLIKIKTEHVDHRINDIILALLNRNKNKIFSDKQVEILLKFILPNKRGYIPKQRIDIASMLVNFDKIPYFSQNNIKTIFLLMARNKMGRIDPRAIQILKEILLPKKFSFLSEQNVIDLLGFLGTDAGEFINPKRLDIALFLLKNKPQAPILMDCFIKSLKDYDIVHSKFIDVILYLHKKKMLAYNLLESLISLLSQDISGHIDPKTLNNLLLLLEPYKNSKPKVVVDVHHILNRETNPTTNMDTSTIHHNIKVLMHFLMNSGTKQFDQSLNQGYNQLELKNLLSKVFQKTEWAQNNEFVLDSLKRNNSYVELTYLLKYHEPVLYHPLYYVKYNIPMTNLLKNIQDILASNSELINDPPKLLRELTLAGNVSEVSSNLNGFRKEDILKLTFEDGKLIQTKILDGKNLNLNDQIKLLQDFNSNISPQEILQQNKINAAKYYATYRGKPPNLAGTGSVEQGGVIENIDDRRPFAMSLENSNLRETKTADEPKRTNELLLNDQIISTQHLLTGVEEAYDKNETEQHQKN